MFNKLLLLILALNLIFIFGCKRADGIDSTISSEIKDLLSQDLAQSKEDILSMAKDFSKGKDLGTVKLLLSELQSITSYYSFDNTNKLRLITMAICEIANEENINNINDICLTPTFNAKKAPGIIAGALSYSDSDVALSELKNLAFGKVYMFDDSISDNYTYYSCLALRGASNENAIQEVNHAIDSADKASNQWNRLNALKSSLEFRYNTLADDNEREDYVKFERGLLYSLLCIHDSPCAVRSQPQSAAGILTGKIMNNIVDERYLKRMLNSSFSTSIEINIAITIALNCKYVSLIEDIRKHTSSPETASYAKWAVKKLEEISGTTPPKKDQDSQPTGNGEAIKVEEPVKESDKPTSENETVKDIPVPQETQEVKNTVDEPAKDKSLKLLVLVSAVAVGVAFLLFLLVLKRKKS